MNNKEMNTSLYNKVSGEQYKFRNWPLTAFPVIQGIDTWGRNRTNEFAVSDANPGVTYLFLNQAIQERDTGKVQPDSRQSIKSQLKAPPAPGGKPPTKSNDREVK